MSEEQRQSQLEWGGTLEATRITSAWKFGAVAHAFFDKSRFVIDEDDGTSRTIRTLRENYTGGLVVVKSHGGGVIQLLSVRRVHTTAAHTAVLGRPLLVPIS